MRTGERKETEPFFPSTAWGLGRCTRLWSNWRTLASRADQFVGSRALRFVRSLRAVDRDDSRIEVKTRNRAVRIRCKKPLRSRPCFDRRQNFGERLESPSDQDWLGLACHATTSAPPYHVTTSHARLRSTARSPTVRFLWHKHFKFCCWVHSQSSPFIFKLDVFRPKNAWLNAICAVMFFFWIRILALLISSYQRLISIIVRH